MSNNLEGYIKSHSHQICYCEAVVDEEGNVYDAEPSHQQYLLHKFVELNGLKDDREAWDIIPMDSNPLFWLVEVLGYISVWYDMAVLPERYSSDQLRSLKELQISGRIKDIIDVQVTREKSKVDYLNKVRTEGIEFIPEKCPQEEFYVFIDGKLLRTKFNN